MLLNVSHHQRGFWIFLERWLVCFYWELTTIGRLGKYICLHCTKTRENLLFQVIVWCLFSQIQPNLFCKFGGSRLFFDTSLIMLLEGPKITFRCNVSQLKAIWTISLSWKMVVKSIYPLLVVVFYACLCERLWVCVSVRVRGNICTSSVLYHQVFNSRELWHILKSLVWH